jgi:DTW domain-containing protein YfiP
LEIKTDQMSQRRAGIYNRCPSCQLNNNLCVCHSIRPFKVESQISLVVHVRELKLTSNTAQFVEKMLPEQARIFIRGRVFENFDSTPILERSGRPLFLYPHEDAFELNEKFLQDHPGPYHLIVPDGNWHQARRVRRREEGFKNLPAVKLPPGILTEYRLRRAPQPEWVCTYEAVAHALGIMEGEKVKEDLMSFFRYWVKTTLFNRTGID